MVGDEVGRSLKSQSKPGRACCNAAKTVLQFAPNSVGDFRFVSSCLSAAGSSRHGFVGGLRRAVDIISLCEKDDAYTLRRGRSRQPPLGAPLFGGTLEQALRTWGEATAVGEKEATRHINQQILVIRNRPD